MAVPTGKSRAIDSLAIKRALLVSAVIGFTFLAYSNSFNAGFLLDNDPIILKDSRIRTVTADHAHRILNEEYWPLGMSGLYRPLTTFSYMFNYSVLGDGTNPSGYHWLNFALHAVNVGLVYVLGLVIFEQVPAALLLAALWGIHPVLTESVTNIVGRADLLGAFGVLAALHAHRKALAATGGRKLLWLTAIGLAVTAGMFSKESTIVVLAVLAIYDLTFGRAASWKARVPSYLAVAIPCVIYLYVRANVLGSVPVTAFPFGDNPLVGADFWTARMTAVKVIGRYLTLLAWPAQLSFDYSFNEIPLFALAVDELGRREGRPVAAGVPGSSGSGNHLLAAAQAGLLRDRVFLRHALAHFEPGNSDRQHHGGTLSVSAVRGCRRAGGLRRAMAVAANGGARP